MKTLSMDMSIWHGETNSSSLQLSNIIKWKFPLALWINSDLDTQYQSSRKLFTKKISLHISSSSYQGLLPMKSLTSTSYKCVTFVVHHIIAFFSWYPPHWIVRIVLWLNAPALHYHKPRFIIMIHSIYSQYNVKNYFIKAVSVALLCLSWSHWIVSAPEMFAFFVLCVLDATQTLQ